MFTAYSQSPVSLQPAPDSFCDKQRMDARDLVTSSGGLSQQRALHRPPRHSPSQVIALPRQLCVDISPMLHSASPLLAQEGLHHPGRHSLQPLGPCLSPRLLSWSTGTRTAVCKRAADSIAHLMPGPLTGRCRGVEHSRFWAARGPLCSPLLLLKLLLGRTGRCWYSALWSRLV